MTKAAEPITPEMLQKQKDNLKDTLNTDMPNSSLDHNPVDFLSNASNTISTQSDQVVSLSISEKITTSSNTLGDLNSNTAFMEDLIQKGVQAGYFKYSDGPDNPKAGKLKVTPEGYQQYKKVTQLENTNENKKATVPFDLSDKQLKTGTVYIRENTEVLRPDQDHLVVTSIDGKILIWGYLTSNPNNDTFQIAQKQIQDPNKPQYFKPFEQPQEISSDKFIEYDKGNNNNE